MKQYGMIIPDDINPFYPETAENIARELERRGDCLLICNAQGDFKNEARFLNGLIAANVSGIFSMPTQAQSKSLYEGLRVPVVFVGQNASHASISSVSMDEEKAGTMAAERLLKNGYRRLVFLFHPTSCHDELLKGFLLGAQNSGIPCSAVHTAPVAGNSLQDSYCATRSLLNGDMPTVIAAQDDFTAFGAWQAIVERELRPGRDIALLGFGDVSLASLSKYKLTSVGCGRFVLETQAVSLMERLCQGAERETLLLAPRMFCRGTYTDKAG